MVGIVTRGAWRLPEISGQARRRAGSALAPLAHALVDHDRGAREAELLTEPAFDETLVPGVELARGEQRERRRRDRRLCAEHDPGLLAAAHRVRVLGDQSSEERVQG